MRVCNRVFSMRPSHRFDARYRSRAHPQSATAAALRAAPQASAASSRAFLIGPPAAAAPRALGHECNGSVPKIPKRH